MFVAGASLDLAYAFTRVSSLSNLRLCHCVSECSTRAVRRLCRLPRFERKEVVTCFGNGSPSICVIYVICGLILLGCRRSSLVLIGKLRQYAKDLRRICHVSDNQDGSTDAVCPEERPGGWPGPFVWWKRIATLLQPYKKCELKL